MSHPAIHAAETQRQAAHPQTSVWVSASAGTGKTKVLTDRVLTLLLHGTVPSRLLCITFTRAAAAEMANRLHARLAGWATRPDAEVTADLAALLGTPPAPETLALARRLFARVLDAPGGMRIMTVHAFCQSVLRRFPLEAGVAPHFQVMEESEANALMTEVRDALLSTPGDTALTEALAFLADAVSEDQFPALLAQVSDARARVSQLLTRHGLDGVLARVKASLDMDAFHPPEAVLAAGCADGAFDRAALARAATALTTGGKTDQAHAPLIQAWLAASAEERPEQWPRYRGVFFTDKGEMRRRLATRAAEATCPDIVDILSAEAQRVQAVEEAQRTAMTAQGTRALWVLADALSRRYAQAKAGRALLDYDDLILKTRALLQQEDGAAWVLYKLDQGLEHLLIDEAQDTSPEQWAVVAALTDEFFAGEGALEGAHTLFVVGDYKQSIYSFQGADPEAFRRMHATYGTRIPESGQAWRSLPLQVSFRSVPAVLALVDRVFSRADASDGVVGEDGPLVHIPAREGHGGRVELWPPLPREEKEPQAPWQPPRATAAPAGGSDRMAAWVATAIQDMLHRAEPLPARGRPVRPGDIMVLVRRRGTFVGELVRALKQRAVPVTGVDRMVLTDQMAVRDLLALADFLLLQEDDLTLATVLKGPLLGLDEDTLFTLCHDRGDTPLWHRLNALAETDPTLMAAADWLNDLLRQADFRRPHELFAHVLGPLGGRARLAAHLGAEAEDPLDEFLTQALAYERLHPPSLQGFVHWLTTAAPQVKRDLEQGNQDAVRVMTVHGAKGLQAPVVFLPDTTGMPQARAGNRPAPLLWAEDDPEAPFLWAPRQEESAPAVLARQAAALARDRREYRRLLYVALTRAEDRLIVGGWEPGKKIPAGCWYDLVAAALAPDAATQTLSVRREPLPAVLGADLPALWVAETPQTAPVAPETPTPPEAPRESLPAWARTPAPPEPRPPRPLAPSAPEEEPAGLGPLSDGDDGARFRRGLLIHRLLQTLPALAPEVRAAAAARFLARQQPPLSETVQRAWAREALAVITGWPQFFGPGSRAEVPLVGRVGTEVVSGQVDRLAVTSEGVWILDYKTNRPPPTREEDIPDVYRRQMALYRAVAAGLYPDRPLHTALLWTDGPRLMMVEA